MKTINSILHHATPARARQASLYDLLATITEQEATRQPAFWQAMRHNDPTLFQRAATLEVFLNTKRMELGRDPVFFTARGMPLPLAIINQSQLPGFSEDEVCDSGYCFL